MQFPGFLGNASLKAHLAELFEAGRIPHAILLEGPAGIGKRTLARVLAAAIICTGKNKPCEQCDNCRKSFSGGHSDIEEIEGGQGPRSFPVGAVRKIRVESYIAPNEAAYKVYILVNAHTMSDSAQNALLKILEEPPAHTVFILTAQSRSMLLPTIRSRVSVFSLNPLETGEAEEFIRSRYPDVDPAKAISDSGGVLGRLGDDKTLVKASAMIPGFVEKLCGSGEFGFLTQSAPFEKDKELFSVFCRQILLVFRDALGIVKGGKTTLSGHQDDTRRLAARITAKQAVQLIEITMEAIRLLDAYVNQNLLVTWIYNRYWQTLYKE